MHFATSAMVAMIMLFPSLGIQAQDAPSVSVEQQDAVAQPETVIKVFQITNADAKELSKIVSTLFQNQEPGLLVIKSSVDERTNSIVASGPAGDLQVVEQLIRRLDVRKTGERGTTVYRLHNAPVQDVAEAINNWLDERAKMEVEGSGDDPPQAMKRRAIVVPEVVSNSLVVSTTLDGDLARELEAVIHALDTRPDMVKVKVLLKRTVDGKETVLSQPEIITLDQKTGSITIGSEQESITVELTPYVIRGDKPAEVTEIESKSDDR